MPSHNLSKKRSATNSGRGGPRDNAGRPAGSGEYGEETKSSRLPLSLLEFLEQYLETYKNIRKELKFLDKENELSQLPKMGKWIRQKFQNTIPFINESNNVIPLEKTREKYILYHAPVAATPDRTAVADDELEEIELEDILLLDPSTSFLLTVVGDSMIGIGIMDKSILVVERTPNGFIPKNGQVVIVDLNSSSRMVKVFEKVSSDTVRLKSANKDYKDIVLNEDSQDKLTIQGVVKNVITTLNTVNMSS